MNTDRLQNNSYSIPNEVPMILAGSTITSASLTALNYLDAPIALCNTIPTPVKNFLYGFSGVTAIAGIVMAIYSAVHLCKEIILKEKSLEDKLVTLGSGVFVSATLHALAISFGDMIPSIWQIGESYSWSFWIGTNLACYTCAIATIAAYAFTAYATYYITRHVLAVMNPENRIINL